MGGHWQRLGIAGMVEPMAIIGLVEPTSSSRNLEILKSRTCRTLCEGTATPKKKKRKWNLVMPTHFRIRHFAYQYLKYSKRLISQARSGGVSFSHHPVLF